MSQSHEDDQAKHYRSQATACEQKAVQEKSLERRNELTLAAQALRALADNEDWLSGTVRRHGTNS